jgi:hypothetical protein
LIASFLASPRSSHIRNCAGLFVRGLSRLEHVLISQGVSMSLLGATVGF